MTDVPTNAEIDASILRMLGNSPRSFSELSGVFEIEHGPKIGARETFRVVDQSIQRLRKRGLIETSRVGGRPMWALAQETEETVHG